MIQKRESKGDLSRRKIVNAAVIAFAKHGFTQATYQEIAKQARVKTPLVGHYFRSKHDLLESCIESVLLHFQEELSRTIQVTDTAIIRLKKNLDANLWLAEKHPNEVGIIIMLYSTALHDARFKEIYSQLTEKIRLRYSEIIHRGVSEHAFHLITTPDLVAEIIHEHVIGGIVNYVSCKQRKQEKKILQAKWGALIQSLTGIRSV